MTYEEFKTQFIPELSKIRSFAGRIRYADHAFQRLGSGTGRIVYDIDGEKALKLAKNAKGIAQNEAEGNVGIYQDTHHIVAEIFDRADDDSWLVAEKAKKVTEKRIKELTGIPSLLDLGYFLDNQVQINNGRQPYHHQSQELVDDMWENEFVTDLVDFIMNYSQMSGDMGRPSSYGEVLHDGQPSIVLTDYGLNDEVYNAHYNRQRNRYGMYELYNFADGNDDILTDADGGDEIRKGMWALMPYGIGDGQNVVDENFINFVMNRNSYPDKPISSLPVLADSFHECVNNLKETLNKVSDKKLFYNNLLELQDYLIKRRFYHSEPLMNEEYELPPVEMFSLDDQKYATELANEVAGKLNLGTPSFIGGGENGFAFEIDNKRIMKLTADRSEADAATKIMRGNPQYLADVYNLYKVFDSDIDKSYFAIIEENVYNKPLDDFREYERIISEIKPNDLDYYDILGEIKKPKNFNHTEMLEFAKLVLTENPEANISNINRKRAYEFLVGILNIRQELINFGIKSVDYTNIKNLGYNDGILKFFDIGGYRSDEPEVGEDNVIMLPETQEINEIYDKRIADKIAAEVAQKIGLNSPKYLASGYNGVAYDIGGDKVLKITKDSSEASDNLKLIGRKLNYIAQPYNVFEITSSTNRDMPKTYAIILEKLRTDSNIETSNNRLDYAFNKIMGVEVPDVIEYYLGEWDDGKVTKEKVNSYLKKNPQDGKYFAGLLRIAYEAKRLGLDSMDYLNPKNLGYKKNGELGFFDVGSGDHQMNPETEKLQVAEDGTSKFTSTNAINQDDFPTYNQNNTPPSIDNDLDANSSLYEEINASEAHTVYGAINTLLDNKRDIGLVTFGSISDGDVMKENLINAGFGLIKIKQSNHPESLDMNIVYRQGHEFEAKRLENFMISKGGYVRDETPEEAIMIGKLLGYVESDIQDYIKRRYSNLNERKKDYVSGSKAVNVKKKCRLGGEGNTSAACNQGDVSNLEFSKVNENM